MAYKLGRLPVKYDDRTLMAGKYMGTVSPPPTRVNWQANPNLQFSMFKNDQLGDCTFATIGHCIQRWSIDEVGAEISVSDDDVVTGYSKVTGYDPETGANDNGAVELDVLNYWRRTGVAGHKIVAYVKLDHHNLDQIKQAINIFGSVYIGFNFPMSAMDQFDRGQPWDVVEGASIDGGHAVSVGAYDSDARTFEVATWGSRQTMTEAFWLAYVDEAYAVIGNDWFNNDKSPQGLDLATLQQDLANIGHNQPNVVPPTPDPVPEPTPTPSPEPFPPVDPNQELAQAARTWLGYNHVSRVNKAFVAAVQKWLESNPS